MTNLIQGATVRQWIEHGPYAWPGGYPLYFVMEDGEPLSFDAARQQIEEIETALPNSGWRVVAVETNWEDPALFCAHTGKRIESAYAEPD